MKNSIPAFLTLVLVAFATPLQVQDLSLKNALGFVAQTEQKVCGKISDQLERMVCGVEFDVVSMMLFREQKKVISAAEASLKGDVAAIKQIEAGMLTSDEQIGRIFATIAKWSDK